jgi:hypothetical protein
MSATASPDHAYFQAVEAVFVRLRGTPFLLSPADWRLASDWHGRGIPLAVVEAALEELFLRRAERGVTAKVQSLRFCAAAVEEAWSRHVELGGGGPAATGATLDVAERLASLARALPPEEGRLAARVRVLDGDVEEVERRLVALDRELLDAAERRLAPAERAAVDERVGESLAALRDRLPAEELEAYRPHLREREVRRRAGLPLLSLFSPEAMHRGDGGGAAS